MVAVRRHNAAFCKECFLTYFRVQVERAVREHRMFGPKDRVAVAVSGGKDSLALWDVLAELGQASVGVHLDLGIGEYSRRSRKVVEEFAMARGLPLEVVDIEGEFGFGIPEAARGPRPACSVCGLTKRYALNRVAREKGFTVLATGHNMDDEAATLLGNVLRWEGEYLARQGPVLEAGPGFVKRVKPLWRLSEMETAAYAFLRGIEYVVEECPLVSGNTQLKAKEALALLEDFSPGTKQSFLAAFLERGKPAFRATPVYLAPCSRCGEPTTGEVCAFCRARSGILARRERARAGA